ncbi:hypothetical protein OPT61_g4151 [Boeremia exigua]|uniref:Uncharacterized protein n=1 Tax=Boeremia exigua TaxID=749465 RepID=A0ACC2IF20_9PLEO|nr:hypothetical protein OPT61_g4151 [Boeremia exigua]
MLGQQDGRYATGTLDIRYEHHTSAKTFREAVRQNCYICRALFVNLSKHLDDDPIQQRRDSVISSSHPTEAERIFSELLDCSLSSKAYLFLQKVDHTYRLRIDLSYDEVKIQHTFHLACRQGDPTCPDHRSVHVRYRTLEYPSVTTHTSSKPSAPRDYGAALQWPKECKCYAPPKKPFFPTRLLSLKHVKSSIETYGNSTSYCRGSQALVNLVETKSWTQANSKELDCEANERRYVTLSHCWGGVVSHRLLRSNYDGFVRGILVADLPKTFQDAIYFASALQGVDYIWIDSLCIIQEDKADWLEEAGKMGRVYSSTFLNLSATAAINSTEGLFGHGDFELLEEDEVTLDIGGLPLAYDRKTLPESPHERKQFLSRRCKIVDASFWENKVGKGPVNTRGWVIQERLMSPRVLHFCKDQVGWECACRDARRISAICDTPTADAMDQDEHLSYYVVLDGIRQRMIKAKHALYGDAPSSLSAFDLWAAVVNMYSKTAITNPEDKLIALSGLASVVAEETKCAYVAGLWRKRLASQLLWHVEPIFRSSDRSFSNPATVKAENHAPSFSWAALDVTGHGITYADTIHCEVYVRVEKCIVKTLTENAFGIVSNARLILWGKLRQARIISRPNNRFGWYLMGHNDLDKECHTNMYLDCPQHEADCIDNEKAQIYALPMAKSDESAWTSKSEYLVCLLLRPGPERGTFRRIGLTKLSPAADRRAMQKITWCDRLMYKILEPNTNDVMLPHDGNYDDVTGRHRFSVV